MPSSADAPGPAAGSRAWLPWALLAGGLVISGCTALKGIQPNDEGLMLQAASRISSGQVPYRDFWWFYPPGQPYLLAGLWKVFGPSLLWWRVVRVLADTTVALLAWRLTARRSGPRTALAVWVVSILAMAYPSGPHPFPIALALALGAVLLFERRPAAAGLLAGLCAAWRIEFAAYLGLGVLLAIAIAPLARAARVRGAARFALAGAATAAVLYLPVVLQAGVADSWDLLIRYPIEDFSAYQGLPFPFSYDGPLNTSSLAGFFADSAENLLAYYVPLVLACGLLASLGALALSFRRARDWPIVATAVLAVGMAHYMLVRPDLFHAAPLAVVGSIVAGWAVTAALERRRAGDGRRTTATLGLGAVAAACLLYIALEGVDRSWLVLRERTVALRAAPAEGVRAAPRVARPLDAAVADVRHRVPAGRPIYVLGSRSDITTAGAPLFYVLAGRPNPTRYDIAAPGVVTSAPVQREIVRDLRRTHPGAVVRWNDPTTAAPEPNRAGRSSGVRLLDTYLAAAYRPAARYGTWTVLVPRAAA